MPNARLHTDTAGAYGILGALPTAPHHEQRSCEAIRDPASLSHESRRSKHSQNPWHRCWLCSQAVLRLTDHQREAMIAAYGALAGRLAAAKQACGGGEAPPPVQQAAAADSGISGSNLVGP